LNHPNIAAIYGIEEAGGRKFLVMELATGETLAERIKRGPIPVDEALGIAKEIAEGLESAHEKGIIHRDLKPANVKITPDAKVKILDFGLAKAYETETLSANLSDSPTMVSTAATNAGVILGTAAYMSPEQAKGRQVDRRTDIFAFGCVLYEMNLERLCAHLLTHFGSLEDLKGGRSKSPRPPIAKTCAATSARDRHRRPRPFKGLGAKPTARSSVSRMRP
jgi:serine/threonine-protein kinase